VVTMCPLASRLTYLVVLAAPLLAACGGADEGRPERPTGTSTEPLDQCAQAEQRLADGWEFLDIIDFEPIAAMPAERERAECLPDAPCQFYFNYDVALSPGQDGCNSDSDVMAAGGTLLAPKSAGDPFIAYALPESRCEQSNYAFHLLGQDIATCVSDVTGRQGWGATLAITLNANSLDTGLAREPYDASEWDGFAFWVRRGDQPSNGGVLASAKDRYTGRPPESLEEDAYCETKDSIVVDGESIRTPDSFKCDGFGLAALADTDWRFVRVPFANLQQKGFGVPSPLGEFEATTMSALEFGFGAGDWDVWVDDVTFYREPH
jgi:hypothetical protein